MIFPPLLYQLVPQSGENELTLASLRLLGRIDPRPLVLRLGLLPPLLLRTGHQLVDSSPRRNNSLPHPLASSTFLGIWLDVSVELIVPHDPRNPFDRAMYMNRQ